MADCWPFPSVIEFQTQSQCNANCSICPYPIAAERFPPNRMSDANLEALVNEVAAMPGVQRIVPYLNNEPFLDRRMLSILRLIRTRASTCEIEVSTNGSALSAEKTDAIVSEHLIDEMRLSVFGADAATYSQLMPGLDFEKTVAKIQYFLDAHKRANSPIIVWICLVLAPGLEAERQVQRLAELFNTKQIRLFGYLDRAGANSIRNQVLFDPARHRISGCILNRPVERLCILSNGDVITCSQDWFRQNVVGNVFKTSLTEVATSRARAELIDRVEGNCSSAGTFICYSCKLAKLTTLEKANVQNFGGDAFLDHEDQKRISVSEVLGTR